MVKADVQVCLTGHKTGCSRSHKVQAKSCISQNDFPIPQYVKISSNASIKIISSQVSSWSNLKKNLLPTFLTVRFILVFWNFSLQAHFVLEVLLYFVGFFGFVLKSFFPPFLSLGISYISDRFLLSSLGSPPFFLNGTLEELLFSARVVQEKSSAMWLVCLGSISGRKILPEKFITMDLPSLRFGV